MFNKAISILLFLFLYSTLSKAQKTGYKDIVIGKNIDDSSLNKYHLGVFTNEENTYGLVGDSETVFCKFPVHGIKIHTDKKGIITEISLQTIDIEISDWNVLFALFKQLRNCITDVVGAQSYTNLVDRKENEAMAIFWNFEKENTTLILSVQDMSVMAHNEKRLFLITWRPYKTKSLW